MLCLSGDSFSSNDVEQLILFFLSTNDITALFWLFSFASSELQFECECARDMYQVYQVYEMNYDEDDLNLNSFLPIILESSYILTRKKESNDTILIFISFLSRRRNHS